MTFNANECVYMLVYDGTRGVNERKTSRDLIYLYSTFVVWCIINLLFNRMIARGMTLVREDCVWRTIPKRVRERKSCGKETNRSNEWERECVLVCIVYSKIVEKMGVFLGAILCTMAQTERLRHCFETTRRCPYSCSWCMQWNVCCLCYSVWFAENVEKRAPRPTITSMN